MKRIKNMSRAKKLVAAGLTVGLTLGLAGSAFAFFTSTGSGTGDASVGSASNWTVSVTSDTSNALLPGSGSETLSYTITNNSAGAQAYSTLTPSVGDSGTCLGSWFTAVASASTPVAGTSIAHLGTATGTITVTMQDSLTNQNACQGLTSVPVTLAVS